MNDGQYAATGRKEIVEAVVIAALTALGNQLIEWTITEVKAAVAAHRQKREDAKTCVVAIPDEDEADTDG